VLIAVSLDYTVLRGYYHILPFLFYCTDAIFLIDRLKRMKSQKKVKRQQRLVFSP
jgi:hypothetical protein